MPVRYFVSQDPQGREQVPDCNHEISVVIEIIKRVHSDHFLLQAFGKKLDRARLFTLKRVFINNSASFNNPPH